MLHLKLVVQKVSDAFRLDRAAVLIKHGTRYEVRGSTGYPFALSDTVFFPEGGVVDQLLEANPSGIRLYLDDPECTVCSRLAESRSELDAVRRLGAGLLMPLRSRRHRVGFLALGGKPAEEAYTQGEMDLLSDAAVQTGVAVENARLTREVAAREQQRQEIEKARDLQESLLPGMDPELPGLAVAGYLTPATEVAGDYYDFIPLDDGRVVVILGDVTGHGLEAGMMMAVAKAALLTQVAADPDLPAMLSAIDRAMRLSASQTIFMTAILVIYDPATHTLDYGIAGHPPPLLVRNGNGRARPLEGGFYPLGIEMDRPYEPETLEVQPDDSLLLYSDGIIEAENPAGEAYGLDRLQKIFAAAEGQSAAGIRDTVVASLNAFTGSAAPRDDVTVVAIKIQ